MRWPWSGNPEAVVSTPSPKQLGCCPECRAEEFVILRSAVRIVRPQSRYGATTFEAVRADISCTACMATFTVRLDGKEPFAFGQANPPAGVQGVVRTKPMNNGHEQKPEESTPPLEMPEDPAALIEMVMKDPSLRLRG